METELMTSVAAIQVRQSFQKSLQELGIPLVAFDAKATWETTDGIHLHWSACRRAAEELETAAAFTSAQGLNLFDRQTNLGKTPSE